MRQQVTVPRTGQVWESTDPREGGRRVVVDFTSEHYAYVRNTKTNLPSTILIRRMTRSLGERGYRLVA
jgi:hypothetical protein